MVTVSGVAPMISPSTMRRAGFSVSSVSVRTCPRLHAGSCTCLPPPLTMPSIFAASRMERTAVLVYTMSSLPSSSCAKGVMRCSTPVYLLTKQPKRKRSSGCGGAPSSASVQGIGLRVGSLRISVFTEMLYRMGPIHRRRSATALASGPKPAMTVLIEIRRSGLPSSPVMSSCWQSTRRLRPSMIACTAARTKASLAPAVLTPRTSPT
mmetsp:Transcript_11334/g.26911  ORF Transcript_11334/g.26911 Transcript_11334/m.26911 type:complete len:208 (+) Transcript_11334:173-796(+)